MNNGNVAMGQGGNAMWQFEDVANGKCGNVAMWQLPNVAIWQCKRCDNVRDVVMWQCERDTTVEVSENRGRRVLLCKLNWVC